jgi:hypothetical protein
LFYDFNSDTSKHAPTPRTTEVRETGDRQQTKKG